MPVGRAARAARPFPAGTLQPGTAPEPRCSCIFGSWLVPGLRGVARLSRELSRSRGHPCRLSALCLLTLEQRGLGGRPTGRILSGVPKLQKDGVRGSVVSEGGMAKRDQKAGGSAPGWMEWAPSPSWSLGLPILLRVHQRTEQLAWLHGRGFSLPLALAWQLQLRERLGFRSLGFTGV